MTGTDFLRKAMAHMSFGQAGEGARLLRRLTSK